MPDFSGRSKGPPEFEAGRRASQRGEGPFRTPRPLPWPGNKRTPRPLPWPGNKRTPRPLSQYSKPIGPSMGTLGKGATQTHTLPRGANALTKEGRAKAFQAGHALPPPSKGSPHGFPVTSPRSWENARDAVGRVKNPARRAALKALLHRTAAQYGKTAALKRSWAAANTRPGLELAVDAPPQPITGPLDLIISRDPDDGSAVVRHRRGGGEIGRIRHGDEGWIAATGGKDGEAHIRQRGALLELIGRYNRLAPSPYRRMPQAAEPLQAKPQQTELMRAYGIPAITTLAGSTPVVAAQDGPRTTTPPGLSPKGATIYKKLRSRGFPHARAHGFARRAQNKGRQ